MKGIKSIAALLLTCSVAIIETGCIAHNDNFSNVIDDTSSYSVNANTELTEAKKQEHTLAAEKRSAYESFSLTDIPEYKGEAYAVINKNVPFFDESELTVNSFETYSEFDDLGRCGVAFACVGKDIMPTEERGKIGSVKPTGWHTIRYDNVDGGYLYNRCHLIAYQLSGENANEQNLITGTRYLNVVGMLPFEDMTANYVENTNNHVMYRVTPMFDGNNLLASGVLMEGFSVEDNGEGICFCVFCYNVQPDIVIDYSSGDSKENIVTTVTEATRQTETTTTTKQTEVTTTAKQTEATTTSTEKQGTTYILNTNTKKFHYSYCSSVGQMKEKNKKEFIGDREDIISQGYSPCKRCNP